MLNKFLRTAAALFLTAGAAQADNIAVNATALTEVTGEGQKCTAVVVEYDVPVDNNSLTTATFTVSGRTITKVYANDEIGKATQGRDGRYVVIELSADDAAAAVYNPKTAQTSAPTLAVQQRSAIPTLNGTQVIAWSAPMFTSGVVNKVVEDFTEFTFIDGETGRRLECNLYKPRDYNPALHYPLVVFLHDMSELRGDVKAPLTQGLGATIWATAEEQAKHPCFVLAPKFDLQVVNDNNEYTDDIAAVANLVSYMPEQYSIDTTRIYLTGQSMGCMSALVLNAKYPQLFAATLYVAGQWDPSILAPLAKKPAWIVVSEGDTKAFPGMNAITQFLETQGAKVYRKNIDARYTPQQYASVLAEAVTDPANIKYTPFFKGSTLKDGESGSEHMATWRHAYGIEPIRDWLFRQRK